METLAGRFTASCFFFISRTFVIRTELEVRLHILQADCAVQTGVRVRWYQHTFHWSTLYPVKLFSTQLLPPVSMHIWLYYYVPLITITARRAFKKTKQKKHHKYRKNICSLQVVRQFPP